MIGNRISRMALGVCALVAFDGCLADEPAGDPEVLPDLGTTTENLALPPPTNVTAVAVGPNRIDVTWNAVAGDLKYYIVDRGTAPGAEVALTTVAPDRTTWISTNLTPGQQYCWDVRTRTPADEISGRSNESCATTPGTVQTPPPAGVTATAISSSRITVAWSAVAGATVYHVYQAKAGANPAFTQIASVVAPTTTTTVANLTAGTAYLFEVSAVTPGGETARSTPPAQATTIAAGLEGYWKFDSGQAGTTTTPDSSGQGRSVELFAGTLATTGLPPVDLNNHAVLHIPAGNGNGQVEARVAQAVPALRFSGGGDFSLSLWARPASTDPTDLVVMAFTECAPVGWRLAQDASHQLFVQSDAAIASFGRSLAPGVWSQVGFTFNHASSTLTMYIGGVQVAATAFHPQDRLAAQAQLDFGPVCNTGASDLDEVQIYSRVLSAAEMAAAGVVPAAPALSVVANNASTETLTWTAVAGADRYYIYRGSAAGNEQLVTSVLASQHSFVAQPLTPLTTYTWLVRATAGGLPYSTSNEVTARTPDILAAPTGVTVSAITATKANVAWHAVTGATGYKVMLSTAGGAFILVAATVPPVISTQLVKLTTKTAYKLEVVAVDSGGNSGHASSLISFSTP